MEQSIAYGMSPYALTEKLNGEGYNMTIEEGKRLYSSYEKDFDVGIRFLRNAGEQALRDGKLKNLGGRMRYWAVPSSADRNKYPNGMRDESFIGKCKAIKREGGNFLIQSVNADMTKQAMIYIRRYKKLHNVRTEFMNQVYDENVTRTHKDDSESFHKAKQKMMIEAAGKYLKNIPMEVEGNVGRSWTK